MAGRPLKLTEEVQTTIIEGLRSGLPMLYACAEASISRETARLWIERGETGEEPFATFAIEVRKAQAFYLRKHLSNIDDQATGIAESGDYKASAWLVEKLYPMTFGSRALPEQQEEPEDRKRVYTADELQLARERLRAHRELEHGKKQALSADAAGEFIDTDGESVGG